MELAISFEGWCGLNWPKWKRLIDEVERMGFVGLFRSDHFVLLEPPDFDSLELVVSLTYLASHSQKVHFGPLVAPLSFRDPIMLARQAMALDDLSGGRMILGLGAGWAEREHKMFGYPLGDVATRIARFEEGVEVITRLVRSDDRVTFNGRIYQLQDAQLLPRPQRATPILIGGNGPKRILPLAARYADIWNGLQVTPEVFRERSALLDKLIIKMGRQPSDVKRTVFVPVICWKNIGELERLASEFRRIYPSFSNLSEEGILDILRQLTTPIIGTPKDVIETMHAYEAAGAEEMMIQYFLVDYPEGLETIAEHVLPHFKSWNG